VITGRSQIFPMVSYNPDCYFHAVCEAVVHVTDMTLH